MEKYDIVIMNDNKSGKTYSIPEGAMGTVIDVDGNICKTLFQNKRNLGDYAICDVEECDLLLCQKYRNQEELNDFIEYLSTCDLTKNAFKTVSVELGSRVKLLVDKPCYERYGVKAGMLGTIVVEFAVRNRWSVLFDIFPADSEGDDILVDESDFEIIK